MADPATTHVSAALKTSDRFMMTALLWFEVLGAYTTDEIPASIARLTGVIQFACDIFTPAKAM
jgi:hypothetical protein